MKTEIRLFKAEHGDCILIKSFDTDQNLFNILVDSGTSGAFEDYIYEELTNLKTIDLLILTHIDDDHIGGFLYLFENDDFSELDIKQIWFNAYNLVQIDSSLKISTRQGKKLEELLLKKGFDTNIINPKVSTKLGEIEVSKAIKAKILSPTPDILDSLMKLWHKISEEELESLAIKISSTRAKSQIPKGTIRELSQAKFKHQKNVDKDIINASSIAFVLTLPDIKILLLGDARDELIREELQKLGYSKENPLEVDYMKISHHGSKNNTSSEFLDMIKCEKFFIITNGGRGRSKHPDREVISRLANHTTRDKTIQRTIYFNYPKNEIESQAGSFITDKEIVDYNLNLIFDTDKLP